jgi:hypothetical protein
MSKAEIYDQKLVESLLGHTNSMVFLVRGDLYPRFHVVSYDYLIGHFVLFHRRIIYHRNIQDSPPHRQ